MKGRPRQGYVILLVIFGAISLAFFGMAMSSMNRGLRSQVLHTKHVQASFQIAYSGFQRLLGKMYLTPWEDRFFRAGPVAESGIALFGGKYDTHVLDSPGQINHADLYVRVTLEEKVRNYVWRVEHVPDLLDAKYFRTVFFSEVAATDYPSGTSPGYGQTINDLLEERKNNIPDADSMRAQVSAQPTLEDVARVIGAPAPVIPAPGALPPEQSGIVPPAVAPGPAGTDTPPPGSLLVNPKPATVVPSTNDLTRGLEQDGRVTVRKISFEHDRYDIRPQSIPTLEAIADMLRANPDWRISIEGHTDSTGGPTINQPLSENRAQAVFNWLVGKGISSSRLQSVGHGQSVPIADDSTANGRAENRRVELVKLP